MGYSVYHLSCGTCGAQYAHMMPDEGPDGVLICPACEGALDKGRKLTGKELIACGLSFGGG